MLEEKLSPLIGSKLRPFITGCERFYWNGGRTKFLFTREVKRDNIVEIPSTRHTVRGVEVSDNK